MSVVEYVVATNLGVTISIYLGLLFGWFRR